MGTIKVAVLEVDGVELDVPTEYDLGNALTHIGFTGGGSSGIPELNTDPVAPTAQDTWVLATGTGSPIGGLLLALTHSSPVNYQLSYKTISGRIVRTNLT